MQLLLIGSGGREHALAWKLAQSDLVETIFVAPGNGGTASLDKTENVAVAATDLDGLVQFAQAKEIALTVVGPEAPLAAGVVDRFQEVGLPIFGPTRVAAELEGSKAFSKGFMRRHGIPTAEAAVFDDFDAATRYLRELDDVPVIKASGLAAGKGVILPETKAEAAAILRQMLLEQSFGEAGATVLVEERMRGPEISVLAFADGTDLAVMPTAQDHKRLLENDQGPNTGGMGAFSPSPLATPEFLAQVERTILQPTLAGMAAEDRAYTGILYAGLMVTPAGPKVLEFNCRFGDPEAQVILPLLKDDLAVVLTACVEGRLGELDLAWRNEAAVTVVMASGGYPGEYTKGVEITGIEEAGAAGCHVFHAGTKMKDGRLLTDGGRVLNVTALGDSLENAAKAAYRGVKQIRFNSAYYRPDIARRRRRR